MQSFKVINTINESVKVEIEGFGTIGQIQIAEQLYKQGLIDWRCRMESQRVRLSDELIDIAINKLNLYPREF